MTASARVATWLPASRRAGVIVSNGRPFVLQNALADYSYQVSPPYPSLQRFEVRHGDHWQGDVALGGRQASVERSEISDVSPRLPMMTDLWVAYDLWIAPGAVSTASFAILGQLHNTPDGPADKAGPPPWAVSLDGPHLCLYTRTKSDRIATGSGVPTVRRICTNVSRGAWHRIVSRVNYDWTRAGRGGVQLWFDGTKVIDAAGPLGYNDSVGPWFKFGIYRGQAAETLSVLYNDITVTLHSLAARIAPSRHLPLIA